MPSQPPLRYAASTGRREHHRAPRPAPKLPDPAVSFAWAGTKSSLEVRDLVPPVGVLFLILGPDVLFGCFSEKLHIDLIDRHAMRLEQFLRAFETVDAAHG